MMGEHFGNWASAEDFLTQRDKIIASLKTSGDGYEILSDPLGLKSNVRTDARIRQVRPFFNRGKK